MTNLILSLGFYFMFIVDNPADMKNSTDFLRDYSKDGEPIGWYDGDKCKEIAFSFQSVDSKRLYYCIQIPEQLIRPKTKKEIETKKMEKETELLELKIKQLERTE